MSDSIIVDTLTDHRLRSDGYSMYRDYDDGRHRAMYATPAFREKYEWIVQAGVVNLCPRIVSSFADRVAIRSWEGPDAKKADDVADAVDLERALALAVREALTAGDAYFNVWPDKQGKPVVWVHRADQAGYLAADDDPSAKRAFYQRFNIVESDGVTTTVTPRLNIYEANGWVSRWVADPQIGDPAMVDWSLTINEQGLRPYDADGTPAAYRTESGGLTWVHVPFDPDAQGGHGRSLLRDVIPIQDGLNHAYHSILVSTERYAKPLRGVLNYQAENEFDPQRGTVEKKPITIDETRDNFIGLDGAGPVFEWTQASPDGLIKVMETYGAWMARVVGMPVTDLIPDIGNVPSGAALRLMAASRTAAIEAFTDTLRTPIHDVMMLLGVDAWPVFDDPAPVDEAELWDRAVIKEGLGFPLKENLTELGYPEERAQQIADEAAVNKVADANAMAQNFLDGNPPATY